VNDEEDSSYKIKSPKHIQSQFVIQHHEEPEVSSQVLVKDTNKRPREEVVSIDKENDEDISILNANKTKQAKLSAFFTAENSLSKTPTKENRASVFLSPRINRNASSQESPSPNKTPTTTNHSPRVVNRTTPFSMNEKKSLFQNQIGAANTSINSSFAERVDLHLCERVSTPPPAANNKQSASAAAGTSREEMIHKSPANFYEHLKVLGLANDTQASDKTLTNLSSSINEKNNDSSGE
jgi:hypothetical protein